METEPDFYFLQTPYYKNSTCRRSSSRATLTSSSHRTCILIKIRTYNVRLLYEQATAAPTRYVYEYEYQMTRCYRGGRGGGGYGGRAVFAGLETWRKCPHFGHEVFKVDHLRPPFLFYSVFLGGHVLLSPTGTVFKWLTIPQDGMGSTFSSLALMRYCCRAKAECLYPSGIINTVLYTQDRNALKSQCHMVRAISKHGGITTRIAHASFECNQIRCTHSTPQGRRHTINLAY